MPTPDGYPEHYHVLPTLKDVGHFLVRLVSQLPERPLAPSEYPKHPERLGAPAVTGAEAMLASVEIPIIERPDAAQLWRSQG